MTCPPLPPAVAPLKIRIDKLVDKWSGSIEIGVTTHNPNNLEYPATMTNLQSGTSPGRAGTPSHGEGRPGLMPGVCLPTGTIMMSGCGILTNGKGTRREYCEFSLDELQVRGGHAVWAALWGSLVTQHPCPGTPVSAVTWNRVSDLSPRGSF